MTDDEWDEFNGIWYYCASCFGIWSINEIFDANEGYLCPRCKNRVDKVEKGDCLI